MKTYLSFSIFCLSAVVATTAHGERPNIIMFLIDDQNPSSIAAFGGDTYTPNLDRMAEEGMGSLAPTSAARSVLHLGTAS